MNTLVLCLVLGINCWTQGSTGELQAPVVSGTASIAQEFTDVGQSSLLPRVAVTYTIWWHSSTEDNELYRNGGYRTSLYGRTSYSFTEWYNGYVSGFNFASRAPTIQVKAWDIDTGREKISKPVLFQLY